MKNCLIMFIRCWWFTDLFSCILRELAKSDCQFKFSSLRTHQCLFLFQSRPHQVQHSQNSIIKKMLKSNAKLVYPGETFFRTPYALIWQKKVGHKRRKSKVKSPSSFASGPQHWYNKMTLSHLANWYSVIFCSLHVSIVLTLSEPYKELPWPHCQSTSSWHLRISASSFL